MRNVIRVFAKQNFESFAMRKFAKIQNTEFRTFANAITRRNFVKSFYFRMFCIAKDAKIPFAKTLNVIPGPSFKSRIFVGYWI